MFPSLVASKKMSNTSCTYPVSILKCSFAYLCQAETVSRSRVSMFVAPPGAPCRPTKSQSCGTLGIDAGTGSMAWSNSVSCATSAGPPARDAPTITAFPVVCADKVALPRFAPDPSPRRALRETLFLNGLFLVLRASLPAQVYKPMINVWEEDNAYGRRKSLYIFWRELKRNALQR